MSHEEAVKAWEQAKAKADRLNAEAAAADREAKRAELDVLKSEGRGHTPHALWIEAWLAHDHDACDRLLRLVYPQQATYQRAATPDEISALEAEAESMEAQP